MKTATTLKEILKPPFTFDKDLGIIFDTNDMVIDDFADVQCMDAEMPMIAEFIVAALNEKWERDFGEPLRWITRYTGDVEYLKCTKCSWDDLNIEHETIFNCCPFCGQRLLPPEGHDE